MSEVFRIKDLNVQYTPELNGGGTYIGQDFLNVLKHKYPNKKFTRCLDWCSGPGFIGFTLLAHNYCDSLCLIDSNSQAIKYACQSIENTPFKNLTTTYNISSIKDLPIQEKFDLVVSNPPHFNLEVYWQEHIHQNNKLIYLDQDWQIHYDFFRNIKSHLTDNGVIILQESIWGCNSNTFDEILDLNELKVQDHYPEFTKHTYPIFYLEITHK